MASGPGPRERATGRFQSLLSWISCIGRKTVLRRLCKFLRFNPCCLGLAVLAVIVPCNCGSSSCFNPCCLGLAVLARSDRWLLSGIERFQSLLSWISCIGTGAPPPHTERLGFQSLLSWISCIGPNARRGVGEPDRVSILVVLD